MAELEAIGVEVPDLGEDHVEAPVRGGLTLMWDTEELIRQIQPGLAEPGSLEDRAGLPL